RQPSHEGVDVFRVKAGRCLNAQDRESRNPALWEKELLARQDGVVKVADNNVVLAISDIRKEHRGKVRIALADGVLVADGDDGVDKGHTVWSYLLNREHVDGAAVVIRILIGSNLGKMDIGRTGLVVRRKREEGVGSAQHLGVAVSEWNMIP